MTPIVDAVAFVDALLASPGVQLARLGPLWPKLRQLCIDKQLGGNDLADAWLAAAVTHQGERRVSFDREFRKMLTRGAFALPVACVKAQQCVTGQCTCKSTEVGDQQAFVTGYRT